MSKNFKRIMVFLVLTFGLMYGSHGLIALLLENTEIPWGNTIYDVLGILGGGAPAFAALIIVYKMYDKEEKKDYWKKVYHYKVGIFWWIITFISPLLIAFGANLIYYGGWWNPDIGMESIIALPLTIAGMIFAGGMEEIGWRGIFQEKLEKKISLPLIGLIIGIIWGVWHGPMFLIDVFAHSNYAFSTYLLSTIAFSMLLTIVVFKTKSVLLAILLHACINAYGNLGFRIPMDGDLKVIIYLVFISFVGAVILHFMERRTPPKESF